MANYLTLSDNRKWAQYDSKSSTGAGSGTIADGTYSYAVVAWYTASEDNLDNAGVGRTVTGFNNLVINTGGADDSSVTLNWLAPSDGRVPHHYSIYFQTGATFDYSVQCTKIASAGAYGYEYTTTFITHTPDGLETFGATPPSVTLNPIIDMIPTYKQKSKKGFNGKHYRKSWASDTLVDMLDLTVTQMSTFESADLDKAHEGAVRILSWLDNGTPLKLVETIATDPTVDPYIEEYYGCVVGFDYLASKGKNSRTEFMIQFSVEEEVKV